MRRGWPDRDDGPLIDRSDGIAAVADDLSRRLTFGAAQELQVVTPRPLVFTDDEQALALRWAGASTPRQRKAGHQEAATGAARSPSMGMPP